MPNEAEPIVPEGDREDLAEYAEKWADWMSHDLEEFVDVVATRTGASRSDTLLYLISERLAQIVEQGITVKVIARHDIHEHPPEADGDEWKH